MPTCKSFGGQALPLALFKIFVGENIQDAESGVSLVLAVI